MHKSRPGSEGCACARGLFGGYLYFPVECLVMVSRLILFLKPVLTTHHTALDANSVDHTCLRSDTFCPQRRYAHEHCTLYAYEHCTHCIPAYTHTRTISTAYPFASSPFESHHV